MSAAQRIIVIQGGSVGVKPRLSGWKFKEFRDGSTATFESGYWSARLFDMDGDATEWWIKAAGQVVANGCNWGHDRGYHFDVAFHDVEVCLISWRAAKIAPLAAELRHMASKQQATQALGVQRRELAAPAQGGQRRGVEW